MRSNYSAFILAALLTGPGIGQVQAAAGTEQLSVADWSQIRTEVDRHRHQVTRDGEGYKARNPRQEWLVRFDGRGFAAEPDGKPWRWGLRLRDVEGKARVRAEANRVTYEWNDGLEEWFINDIRGLEHGFTLQQPREIRLAAVGGLRPRAAGAAIEFVDGSGAARVTYGEPVAWDATGRKLPIALRVEDGSVLLAVNDQGAKYPVTIDPIAQQAYAKASNTDPFDFFGYSIAVSGNTVVVGAPLENGGTGNPADNSVVNAGAAYVFVRSGNTWSQQAYLKPSVTDTEDNFGTSVAISGDTIVVGVPLEDSSSVGINGNQTNNNAADSGAVYVFVRNGSTWSQQAYIKASNTAAGDQFGTSAGISGDTLIVGAPGQAGASGAAYVFFRTGTTWAQQGFLRASNAGANDQFGASVSVSGNSALVGAPREDSFTNGVRDSGAAYVFVRTGTTWAEQMYLKASNAGVDDLFGTSVSLSGNTAVVGAPAEDGSATGVNGASNESATNSGAAYVFFRSGATWAQQAYLKASNTGPNDEFGRSVAVQADVIAAGASRESSSATGINGTQNSEAAPNSGAVYVFARGNTTWAQQGYVKASNTASNDYFGFSVALGGNNLAVGASLESSNATGINGTKNTLADQSGAAYFFDLPPVLNTLPGDLRFGSLSAQGLKTGPQTVLVSTGGNTAWTATSNRPWITVTGGAGAGSGSFTVSVNPAGLAGVQTGEITVTSGGALNAQQTIPVVLTVQNASAAPIGTMDTPADGATNVAGAIGVTGWAVDDLQVARVEIYRDPVTGENPASIGPNGVWIGNAAFTAGARPDIVAAYPTYPLKHQAGWGLQVLTNALPNSSGAGPRGNGTFVLRAVAVDIEGNSFVLGQKTIHVNNATANRPFGTIDFPAPGETVSGIYTVRGWALTPGTATIPTNGSTIRVFVDGIRIGTLQPNGDGITQYNRSRPDVASYFPAYTNSGGPGGRFQLDTTTLTNGVHTLEWAATDDQGRVDGMGSRYIIVQN